MSLLGELREPTPQEASENLRMIRDLMERSTRYSTFSGLSGVLAGCASVVGCLVTRSISPGVAGAERAPIPFLLTWAAIILFAIGADFLLTKRHAARVGKRILSRLGKQMIYAAVPGLGTGGLLTLFLLQRHLLADVYGVWMLCYGIAVSAVGLFSQREVKSLGAAFLAAGSVTLLLPSIGLNMMAITFGGFHIVYGILMARKVGW